MIAFGLIALAVVLYILGLTDSYESGLSIKPMDQFAVYPLFGDGPVRWYTPTNATLWMGLAVLSIAVLMVMGTGGRAVIPSRSQSMAELAYGFIRKMVEDVAGKDALPYFPYIFTAFLFILFANFLALDPHKLQPHPSHIAVTVILALTVFISVTVIGFVKNGATFPEPLLGHVGATGPAPDPRGDRADLVFRAARQPLGSFGRRGHGGSRRSQGLRGLRRRHGRGQRGPDHRGDRDLTVWRSSWPPSRPTCSPSSPASTSRTRFIRITRRGHRDRSRPTLVSQDFSNFQRKEIGLWKAISHKWVSSSAQALPVWAPVSRRSGVGNVAGNFLAGALRNPSAAASQTATPLHRHRIRRSARHLCLPDRASADVRRLSRTSRDHPYARGPCKSDDFARPPV